MHNHLSYRGSITVTCSEKSFLTLMSTQIPFSVPSSMVATAVPARPYPHPHPLSGHPHTPRAPCCKTLWLPAGWLLSVHERPPPHLETGVRGRNRSGRLWGPWYRVQILFLVQWEGIWEFWAEDRRDLITFLKGHLGCYMENWLWKGTRGSRERDELGSWCCRDRCGSTTESIMKNTVVRAFKFRVSSSPAAYLRRPSEVCFTQVRSWGEGQKSYSFYVWSREEHILI